MIDPIIEEIHKIRDEHARKYNYNLMEIFNDLKEQEKKSKKIFISLPIKRVRIETNKEIDIADNIDLTTSRSS